MKSGILVCQVIAGEGQECDEVNIYFVDTQAISQLHKDFFNDPSPTDCIYFPIDDTIGLIPYRLLGEVFRSVPHCSFSMQGTLERSFGRRQRFISCMACI